MFLLKSSETTQAYLDPKDALEKRYAAVMQLRDFAVSTGYAVPDAVINGISALDISDLKKAYGDLLMLERSLVEITNPLSILNMPTVSSESVAEFKKTMLALGGISLFLCIGSSVYCNYTSQESGVSFVVSIMIYGVCLGILGAVSYQMFNIIGTLREQNFKYYDAIGNYIRIVNGALLGWLFVTVFSFREISSAMQFDDAKVDVSQYFWLLSPFLAGYCSELVTGILSNLINGAKVAMGLENKK